MPVTLHPGDAIQLAEMLQLIANWLDSDPEQLQKSLTSHLGHPAYGVNELRAALHRFIFLIGGDGSDDDGRQLFGDHTF